MAQQQLSKLLAPVTQRIHQICGEFFPSDYFVIDTETTGFNRKTDLITEWGHTLVRNRKVENKINLVINWYDHPSIPEEWLTDSLNEVRRAMANQGKTYRVTPEIMREEGVSPAKVIPWLHDLMDHTYKTEGWIVSHNGVKFDFEMLDSHFQQDLGEPFRVHADRVVDTGCIEKASQLMYSPNARMKNGETLRDYFLRIGNWRAAGVFWNIEHCFNKYDLADSYNIDESKLHTAGEDSYAVHCLLEEFRKRLDARSSAAPIRSLPTQSQSATPHREQNQKRRVGQRNR